MPITNKELLEHAQALHEANSDASEVQVRTVVGRAYYSVHHLARQIADDLCLPQVQDARGGSHAQLYKRLMNCPTTVADYMKVRRIGIMAANILNPYRVWADYHLSDGAPTAVAENSIAKANQLHSLYNQDESCNA